LYNQIAEKYLSMHKKKLVIFCVCDRPYRVIWTRDHGGSYGRFSLAKEEEMKTSN